ncbi:uncharacterized protein LOC115920642 [Strongylocentrotus purpuratus]|uniref:Uncharacterized protein n=1 Tax=Strongylocentrotus purpuratus TaxID=7668 RepID=A0A7M7NBP0_STRPU|nr:uncharacterized protein LOC115920642 [Strongylocentrotus purpuratus]
MLFKLQDMASLHKVESGGGTKSQQLREPLSGGGKKNITRPSATSTGGTSTRHLASSIKHPSPPSLSSSPPSVLHGDGEKDATFSSTSQSRIVKSVSFQSQKNFEEEPGGQSLQRAMKHLSRLKTLVAIDTASPSSSQAARASSL